MFVSANSKRVTAKNELYLCGYVVSAQNRGGQVRELKPLCRVQLLLELDAQLLTDAFESIDVLLVLTLVLNLLLDTFENADGG